MKMEDDKGVQANEKDVVSVRGLPDFSEILGCLVEDDNFTHLGQLFIRRTACGKPIGGTILSRNVDITCPTCIAEIRYRAEHPEAAREKMGVVTHKQAKP